MRVFADCAARAVVRAVVASAVPVGRCRQAAAADRGRGYMHPRAVKVVIRIAVLRCREKRAFQHPAADGH